MKKLTLFLILALPISIMAQPKLCVGKDSTKYVLDVLQQQTRFTVKDTVRSTDQYYFVNLASTDKKELLVMIYYNREDKIERIVVRGNDTVLSDFYCKVYDQKLTPAELIKKGASTKLFNGQMATYRKGNEDGSNASIVFRVD